MNTEHVRIKTAEEETTEIVCILDRSTSIRTSGLIEKTIEGFNSFLADQKKQPGKAVLTLCLFDGGMGYGNTGKPGETYEIVHAGIDIHTVPELNKDTFVPKGMTAMYDAIGITIDNVAKRMKDAADKPDKVVFLIMTDGEENSSKEYNQKTVFEAIQKHKTDDKWAFIFIGANIDTMQAGSGMGVSTGNTLGYTGTSRGVATAFTNMSMSVSNLRKSASSSKTYAVGLDSLIADNGAEKEDINDNKS